MERLEGGLEGGEEQRERRDGLKAYGDFKMVNYGARLYYCMKNKSWGEENFNILI